jgi:hypothetical protein
LLMGSLFIPVIPTNSANLAGTASILTQWWVGQGVDAFGFSGINSNIYKLNNNKYNTLKEGLFANPNYEAELLKKFGGMVEGQYYFNNQWFINAVYGVSKAFGVSRARSGLTYIDGVPVLNGVNGMEWGFFGDNAQTIQQLNMTLWYRPIQAIKFGLQYSYVAATYYQYVLPAGSPAQPANWPKTTNDVNRSHFGDDHRVEFVGFFYF